MQYRIRRRWFGYEPQMLYNTGYGAHVWFPLNDQGYWLEPDAFNDGVITKRLVFTRKADAEAVMRRARAINSPPTLIFATPN